MTFYTAYVQDDNPNSSFQVEYSAKLMALINVKFLIITV